jgi:hypothetical protein
VDIPHDTSSFFLIVNTIPLRETDLALSVEQQHKVDLRDTKISQTKPNNFQEKKKREKKKKKKKKNTKKEKKKQKIIKGPRKQESKRHEILPSFYKPNRVFFYFLEFFCTRPQKPQIIGTAVGSVIVVPNRT